MLLEHHHVDPLASQHEPEHRPGWSAADHTARGPPEPFGLLGFHGIASFPLSSGDRLHVQIDDLFDLLLCRRTRRPFGKEAVEDSVGEQGSYEHTCRRFAEATHAETAREPELSVVPREGVEAHRHAYAAEEPTYGVARVAGSDDGAHHREGEQRNQVSDHAGIIRLAEREIWNGGARRARQHEPAHKQRHGEPHQRPGEPGSGAAAVRPIDPSILLVLPLRHDTTLASYRLLSVTVTGTR